LQDSLVYAQLLYIEGEEKWNKNISQPILNTDIMKLFPKTEKTEHKIILRVINGKLNNGRRFDPYVYACLPNDYQSGFFRMGKKFIEIEYNRDND